MSRDARLRFEPEGLTVAVAPGTRVLDVCDEHAGAGIPFSCRSATCGTCRVRVLAGGDALSSPSDEELDLRDVFGDGPDVRLACQVVVLGAATIVLEPVDS